MLRPWTIDILNTPIWPECYYREQWDLKLGILKVRWVVFKTYLIDFI